jgi:hypothetical protein
MARLTLAVLGALALALPLGAGAERSVAPIEGVWTAGSAAVRVEATGAGTYRGVVKASDNRCFAVGETIWQLAGSGTSYKGTNVWKFDDSCGVAGVTATTWTVQGDTLIEESADPEDGSIEEGVWMRDKSGGTPDEPVLDPGLPAQPDVFPQASTAALSISVRENGTVTSRPVRSFAARAADAPTIRCGAAGFACFDRSQKGSKVDLVANPAQGYRFAGWGGACAGKPRICRVTLASDRDVSASFAPQKGAAAVGASLSRPRFNVGWQASIGKGQLTVRGRVTAPARLRIELRRPGGAPLLVRTVSVPAGQFRKVTPLRPGSLARGAILLPGGFIVVLRGRSGPLQVPLQLQTLVLPAPAEGVARRAYASATENGPPAPTLPAGAKEAWAHFQLEAQPKRTLKVTVSWFSPSGKLVGTIEKPNRPDVESFARSELGLGSGLWRVELRAGTKLVKQLAVRVAA